jgi:uridine phosphorylase
MTRATLVPCSLPCRPRPFTCDRAPTSPTGSVAEAALPGDGASRALGATGPVAADAGLLAALRAAAPAAHTGTVVSADLFYDPDPGRAAGWAAEGALAIEMEAATIFAVAVRHGLAAACVCAVSDPVGSGERIGADALLAAEESLGRAGAAALL